ncbi:AsmA family protein [Ramlibacter humi]|uniref:AsmA family protein n=1 Tax=Ramlibacter humi TaxID=2530451 RepID=A0A4Z0BX67_9BURK|nr:AsmA family protein [Ramlibacter humi]TFZ03937.1 AsmA family protein [Ramlibacter humi]
MNTAVAAPLRSRIWFKVLLGIAIVLAVLVLMVAFFPWDLLRGPVNRYVSEKTGRHFEITRRLDVKLGRTTRVLMDGIQFANPDWAQDRDLVRAERAEVEVRLVPLLKRQIVLPSIYLLKPQLGLQQEPDGRRTWALGGDTKDERNVPSIGALVIDDGTVHYVARGNGADITAHLALDDRASRGAATRIANANANGNAANDMPLRFRAEGKWQDQAFTANGRTGDVLYLSAPLQKPFPAEVQARTGGTSLQARGAVASLATLDGADVRFQLQGPNLAQLYHLVGVALPDTPQYSVAGQLSKKGDVFHVQGIKATVGHTDMAGDLSFDRSGQRPLLAGKLQSRTLDFVDLAAVIGLNDDRRGLEGQSKSRQEAAAPPPDARGKKPKDPNRKVLPAAPLDVSKLKSMDADVRIDAAKIVNAKGLPLDRASARVNLKNGVLVLDPLDMGVAGGQLAGVMRIDANPNPAMFQTRLDGRGLELSKLVPRSKLAANSVGKLQAQVDLSARGKTVAEVLAHSNGNLALLMGKGEISNILLEFAGLDAGEIVKFLVKGDDRVKLRCAATAFEVKDGLMTSRALLLDTVDTVFYGGGTVNLAKENMDIVVRPYPKDKSILALRAPLHVAGTFGAPDIGVEKGPLAGRAIAALALGAVNPLLALAATVETGPGHDADCAGAIQQAGAPRAESRVARTAPPEAGSNVVKENPAQRMGAAGAHQPPAAPNAPPNEPDRPVNRPAPAKTESPYSSVGP